MTRAEIAALIHTKVGLSKKESGELTQAVLDTVRQALERGEEVKLSGFGHFILREKKERRGRNPKTGEEIMITPRRVVTFRASQLLKQKLIEDAA